MHWISAEFLCIYVPGFQIQTFKQAKILLERSKNMKEQKENKWSIHKKHSLAPNAVLPFVD